MKPAGVVRCSVSAVEGLTLSTRTVEGLGFRVSGVGLSVQGNLKGLGPMPMGDRCAFMRFRGLGLVWLRGFVLMGSMGLETQLSSFAGRVSRTANFHSERNEYQSFTDPPSSESPPTQSSFTQR